jgi:uncharacterized protein (TIGR02246 family)
MSEDEQEIRDLIERWVAAVSTGDLEGVLVDHAEDIVMFDVPPPREGVRGFTAYRDTWPGFLSWQQHGGCFELTSLEVTAGADTAFAHALLRCGTTDELARDPDHRLRLTVGLRKEGGRWLVSHEHHSFPDTAGERDAAAVDEVRAVHEQWFADTAALDLDALMAHVAADVVSYEHEAPLQYVGVEAVREVCRTGLEATGGAVGWTVPELQVLAQGDLAVAWGLNQMEGQGPDGVTALSWSRGTRVFRRIEGGWAMVHQHVSYPYDPRTGQAATGLHP